MRPNTLSLMATAGLMLPMWFGSANAASLPAVDGMAWAAAPTSPLADLSAGAGQYHPPRSATADLPSVPLSIPLSVQESLDRTGVVTRSAPAPLSGLLSLAACAMAGLASRRRLVTPAPQVTPAP